MNNAASKIETVQVTRFVRGGIYVELTSYQAHDDVTVESTLAGVPARIVSKAQAEEIVAGLMAAGSGWRRAF